MSMNEAARLRQGYLNALRKERETYLRKGMADRAAGVDAEIARVEGEPVGRSEVEVKPKPRRRKAAP